MLARMLIESVRLILSVDTDAHEEHSGERVGQATKPTCQNVPHGCHGSPVDLFSPISHILVSNLRM